MEVSFPKLGIELNIDRVAFSLFGLSIYWYALLIMTGFLLAVLYARFNLKRFDVKWDPLVDVVLVGLFFGLVGARAYYVLFRISSYHSLWDMLNVRDGGLAIYGGVIAAFVSGLIMCRYVEKIEILPVFDIAAVGFLIGQGIGRWGNFMNQEAFGSQTDAPWGMYSPNTYYYTMVDGAYQKVGPTTVHPCFLYESLWCLAGFILLHIIGKRFYRFKGQIFLSYLVWYGLGRAWIEGLRTDSLWLVENVIKVSQLLAILCVFVAGAFLYMGWNGQKFSVPTFRPGEKDKKLALAGMSIGLKKVGFAPTVGCVTGTEEPEQGGKEEKSGPSDEEQEESSTTEAEDGTVRGEETAVEEAAVDGDTFLADLEKVFPSAPDKTTGEETSAGDGE